MNEKRKDEHIMLALNQNEKSNDFDLLKLDHHSIPKLSINDINLTTKFLEFDIPLPFYINAMTGGSEKAKTVNENLSKLANHFNIPLVLGSASNALKDESLISTYSVSRNINKTGIIVANVSANASLDDAKKAIKMVNANALSIHINVIQELAMAEGDRNFTNWQDNIKTINNNLDVPVIIKEVGFGFSVESLELLANLGVKYVDLSGKGGTNFAKIENERSGNANHFWQELGISTLRSLINANEVNTITYYASGGIRNALDIVKSLILGAKACGLSKYFLERSFEPFEEAVSKVNDLILDIKKIMVMLNRHSIQELQYVGVLLDKK